MADPHIPAIIRKQAERYGERTAMRYRNGGSWADISWREVGDRVQRVARALVTLGVEEGAAVGILSHNRPEWTLADIGILAAAAVPVPIYPTSTPAQAAYIVRDASVRVLFVGGRAELETALAVRDLGEPLTIVVFNPGLSDTAPELISFAELLESGTDSNHDAELAARQARVADGDLLTLIYTSGTTGEPKGVMLTHANMAAQLPAHDQRLPNPGDHDVSLCFLPLSHVFERCWTWYALSRGMTVCYLDDPAAVIEALQELKPTVMCAVPRFYEKIHAAVMTRLATAPAPRRALFRWAIGVGRRHADCRGAGRPISLPLALAHRVADRLVLAKIRGIVGGRIRFFPCAGAFLAPEIELFFHSVGLVIAHGYGLTETTATVSVHETQGFRIGTVGKPMPGLEVRIGDGDEILVRGATVMKGYYHKPEATVEALEDGWLHTGDAGRIDDEGNLVITDRIKDLIKTSGGKYVAPQLIESHLATDPLLEQAAVVGDGHKFITALLVPAFPVLEEWGKRTGLTWQRREDLLALPEVQALYRERIDEHNRKLARFEQIKRFTLLPNELTIEGGEITPTMKIKRRAVESRYAPLIDAMYADLP